MADLKENEQNSQAKQIVFEWEGKNAKNKPVNGQIKAVSENVAKMKLRNKDIKITKIKKKNLENLEELNRLKLLYLHVS